MTPLARKFDWDEAKRLRRQGLSYQRIADELGVSMSAVVRVIDPRRNAQMKLRNQEVQASGICSVCGNPCSWNPTLQPDRSKLRCHACGNASRRTTIRDNALKCASCGEWKWDTEFPWNRHKSSEIRRGRHGSCRSCLTKLKRSYRERTKAPCSSCGTPVTTADRRNKTKPLECHSCAMRRISREQRALSASGEKG